MYKKDYYHQNKDKFREYRRRFKDKYPNYWRRYKEKKDVYMKKYTQRPEVKLKRSLYQAKYILNGKRIPMGFQKRDKPNNICEVCNKGFLRLEYHHWDDTDLSKGVWVCHLCHQLSEGVDKGLVSLYLKLKQQIEEDKDGS